MLFSAHGVPQSYIAAGDPYQRQIEECVRLLAAEVQRQQRLLQAQPQSMHVVHDQITEAKNRGHVEGNSQHIMPTGHENSHDNNDGAPSTPGVHADLHFHLSFQSRVGPVKWLEPYTEEKLEVIICVHLFMLFPCNILFGINIVVLRFSSHTILMLSRVCLSLYPSSSVFLFNVYFPPHYCRSWATTSTAKTSSLYPSPL